MEHEHLHEINNQNEKKTLIVIVFTIITMVAEVLYGYITNSMALLADGYHMGTHTLALGLTYLAYILIRKYKDSQKFPQGTEKIGILTAYTSSIFLAFTGMWIISEAILRLVAPIDIQFNEAIIVAIVGLVVNSACVLVMNSNNNEKEHEDYNFKSAYYHILADILTSVLAIFALVIGKFYNVIYLDSAVGLLGGILIIRWAIGILTHTAKVLVDMKED